MTAPVTVRPLVTMREALADPQLLGEALPGDSWLPWRILLIAAMGEALSDHERVIFAEVTQREREPGAQVEEFWGAIGRRSGKTRAAGTLGAYVGGLCEHHYLAAGERGVLPILAASTGQAQRAFMHAKGILQGSPVLSGMIEGDPTSDTIRLSTRIDIEIRPANFKTIRGITAPAAIADEVAFWHMDGTANPDAEILNALRPALATTGGMLWVISSPYAKRGEVYGAYKRDFGSLGDPLVLVAKGPSKTFNPLLPQRTIDRAFARDAAVAAAEYGGEFRNDVEAFLSREVVDSVVAIGRHELPPAEGPAYLAFVDPSGGSADSFTLAIAHQEDSGAAVLDLAWERRPPFSPDGVIEDFVLVLQAYGITSVMGDRYAGEFPREAFRKRGIAYELSEMPASDYYRELLPLVNSGRVQLLDNGRLIDQLVQLERRTARSGKDQISHPPHGHDDLANAVAGALCRAAAGGDWKAVWMKLAS